MIIYHILYISNPIQIKYEKIKLELNQMIEEILKHLRN